MAKSIQSLRVLLATVAESVNNVAYLTLLLFLFIFIFAVFGMQGGGPQALASPLQPRLLSQCRSYCPISLE